LITAAGQLILVTRVSARRLLRGGAVVYSFAALQVIE
jgi:hypothetical protein